MKKVHTIHKSIHNIKYAWEIANRTSHRKAAMYTYIHLYHTHGRSEGSIWGI